MVDLNDFGYSIFTIKCNKLRVACVEVVKNAS